MSKSLPRPNSDRPTKSLPRRQAIQTLGAGGALIGLGATSEAPPAAADESSAAQDDSSVVDWADTHDRVWLSGNCWANPMEDWVIRDGAAECTSTGGDRNVDRKSVV